MTPEQIAARRGWQTLVDGGIAVAIVGLLVPLVGSIGSADGWSAWLGDWRTWTWTAWQGGMVAGLTAAIAWMRRRWVDRPEGAEPRRQADG